MEISKFIYTHSSRPIALNSLTGNVFVLDPTTEKVLRGEVNDTYLFDELAAGFDDLVSEGIFLENNLDKLSSLRDDWRQTSRKDYESLHIITTTRCNLSCKYCFVQLSESSTCTDMNEDTLLNGLEFFFKDNPHPNPLVTFYGGEPLLIPELMWKAVDYIENKLHRSISKRIITNGIGITEEIADQLHVHDFEVGISVDGAPEAHNTYRQTSNGKGSFYLVEKAVHILTLKGIPWNALCTVGSHNVRNLKYHVEYIASMGPSAIALNMPRGLDLSNDLESGILPSEFIANYREAIDKCYDLALPELHFLKMMRELFSSDTPMRPCSGCGSQVALAPDGRVGPCQGYVASGKYFELQPTSISVLNTTESFAKWESVDHFSSDKCVNCSLLPFCNDDCVMDRERRSGKMSHPSDFYCKMRKEMADIFLERCECGLPLEFNSDA